MKRAEHKMQFVLEVTSEGDCCLVGQWEKQNIKGTKGGKENKKSIKIFFPFFS